MARTKIPPSTSFGLASPWLPLLAATLVVTALIQRGIEGSSSLAPGSRTVHTAAAQDESPPALATPFASTPGLVSAMAADDGVGWIAQGTRLTAIDLEAAPPVAFGPPLHLSAPGSDGSRRIRDLATGPGGMVIAAIDGVLHLVDGSDPSAPRPVATLAVGDRIDRIVTRDDMAYLIVAGPLDDPVAVVNAVAVDLGDPAAPRITQPRLLPAGAPALSDLAVAGDALAVGRPPAVGTSLDIAHLFDLSDPRVPRSAARLQDASLRLLAGGRREGRAVLAGVDVSGLVLFDVEDPSAPRELRRVDLPEAEAAGSAAQGLLLTDDGEVYLTGHRQLSSFYTGGIVSRVPLDGDEGWDYLAVQPFHARMAGDGSRLLLAEEAGVSVHDPARRELGLWPTVVRGRWVDAMAGPSDGGGPHILATSPIGGLYDLVHDGQGTLWPRASVTGWTWRFRVSGDAGWVVAGSHGSGDVHDRRLEVFRARGNELEPSGAIDLREAGGTGAITYAQHERWLATFGRGEVIRLYDLAAGSGPAVAAKASFAAGTRDLALDAARVVTVGYGGPPGPRDGDSAPVWLQAHPLAGLDAGAPRIDVGGIVTITAHALVAYQQPQVAIEGKHAFVLLRAGCTDDARSELHVIDLSNPAAPRRVTGLRLPALSGHPVVEDGILLLAGQRALAIDVRQPAAPRILGALEVGGRAIDAISAADGIVVAASRSALGGVFAFAPDLPWRSGAGVATPTPPPSPTAGPSPTATAHVPCPATATPTPRVSTTPSPAPGTGSPTAPGPPTPWPREPDRLFLPYGIVSETP